MGGSIIYFLILQKTSKNLEVSDIFRNFVAENRNPCVFISITAGGEAA